MNYNLQDMATFGVAGNFTGHLEQAGEAKDFTNIKTKEENAPKAIFPTYIPSKNNLIPEFLKTFPFDSEKIIFPKNEENLQIEPECAIICDVIWNNDKVEKIIPIAFGASNDCSIRKDGAKKISQKKNWGSSSKGLAKNLIPIDEFSESFLPPYIFDDANRAVLRAELDAYYARLYGLTRTELQYILDPHSVMGQDYPSETFRVLKESEIAKYGEYRTQRLVLEAWDRME